MDIGLRELYRRNNMEFVGAEELITRRLRAGVCIFCARSSEPGECGCWGVYVYQGENEKGIYRLKRNERSTLPWGILVSLNPETRNFTVLHLYSGEEREIEISLIKDLEYSLRRGFDIGDKERELLASYWESFYQAGLEFSVEEDTAEPSVED